MEVGEGGGGGFLLVVPRRWLQVVVVGRRSGADAVLFDLELRAGAAAGGRGVPRTRAVRLLLVDVSDRLVLLLLLGPLGRGGGGDGDAWPHDGGQGHVGHVGLSGLVSGPRAVTISPRTAGCRGGVAVAAAAGVDVWVGGFVVVAAEEVPSPEDTGDPPGDSFGGGGCEAAAGTAGARPPAVVAGAAVVAAVVPALPDGVVDLLDHCGERDGENDEEYWGNPSVAT